MARQAWLASAARRWGLDVLEVDGWQTRGDDSFSPGGTVAHHTAGPSGSGDMPSLNVLVNGRPDLPGPLCNYGLGRSGTVYVVASGRANHAGSGGWQGLSGNSSVIGIEAENDGYQPWPVEQLDAYGRLGAAVCETLGVPADFTCRHAEWTSRKPDPHDLDGDAGRATVARLLGQGPGGGGTPGLTNEELTEMFIGQDQSNGRIYLISGNTKLEFPIGGGGAGGTGNVYADEWLRMLQAAYPAGPPPKFVALNPDIVSRIPSVHELVDAAMASSATVMTAPAEEADPANLEYEEHGRG